jgi:hypothetical protein
LLFILAPASAAAAQFSPEAHVGSRVPQKAEMGTNAQTRDVMRQFAECLVKRQPTVASRFILDRSTLRISRPYEGLLDGNCLVDATDPFYDTVGLRMAEDSMRFAIAEALLRREIGNIDPATLVSAEALSMPILQEKDYQPEKDRTYSRDELAEFDSARQRERLILVEYRFGECVVRANPQGSRAYLQTADGSDTEGAALQALMPTLGNCVEKGAQFKLDRRILRGSLAFNYYALAHAPRTPVPAHP